MSTIVVIGDYCEDVTYQGEVTRISPEAPIAVFKVLNKKVMPGMAGNVAACFTKLGHKVNLIIPYHVDSKTKKNRYYAGDYYLYRIDEDVNWTHTKASIKSVIKDIKSTKDVKAIVMTDYNRGMITKELVQEVVKYAKKHKIITVLDGNKTKQIEDYAGVDFVKLNDEEYNALCSKPFKWTHNTILHTKGNRGYVLHSETKFLKKDAQDGIEAKDVTGAGDTFTAWFTHKIIEDDSSILLAADWANTAAGISVEHKGCYCPDYREVNSFSPTFRDKKK